MPCCASPPALGPCAISPCPGTPLPPLAWPFGPTSCPWPSCHIAPSWPFGHTYAPFSHSPFSPWASPAPSTPYLNCPCPFSKGRRGSHAEGPHFGFFHTYAWSCRSHSTLGSCVKGGSFPVVGYRSQVFSWGCVD